jgi:hypothetical protein
MQGQKNPKHQVRSIAVGLRRRALAASMESLLQP